MTPSPVLSHRAIIPTRAFGAFSNIISYRPRGLLAQTHSRLKIATSESNLLLVGAALGYTRLILASEAEVQASAILNCKIVQHKHFMHSPATQRALAGLDPRSKFSGATAGRNS